ncbi:DUF4345 domain-containing protein [Leptobacterium flavescens]|uniref:DUF4345 domain-containing protein n=1 Tax=Leptobacterium flavescens TaxID=472055 RepID=A0A6P0UR76_9FLAO|nr:DUF4345 domain-containing protein [Leptobacterium flavescens]NER15397.1 DUF4345 domain-containing protein [Leptobacterium flavescens]
MRNSKVLKTFLVVSGLLLTFIGSATLFMPVEMKGGSGIDITGNISVINDVRASSALFLAIAVLTILGAFLKKLTYTSSLVSSLLFLSLGVGRLISILVDGMPVDGLVKATGLEFILGITGAILFAVYRDRN